MTPGSKLMLWLECDVCVPLSDVMKGLVPWIAGWGGQSLWVMVFSNSFLFCLFYK